MRVPVVSVIAVIATLVTATSARAQYFDSGSSGGDGAFNPSCTPTPCTVTVILPPTGVFNYTTVNVPSGVTVKYVRNTTNTPVTILATGNVTIAGTIDVSGSNGGDGGSGTKLAPNGGAGGPGGFDGGSGANGLISTLGGSGLGPGGGGGGSSSTGGGGSGGYLTLGGAQQGGGAGAGLPYGTPTLVPLIGGSGGGGGGAIFPTNTGGGGGGGGGAVLIASGTSSGPTTITLSGVIRSKGGQAGSATASPGYIPAGGGSGGAVRLVSHSIAGTGSIDVTPTFPGSYTWVAGAYGRIRIEAVSSTATFTFPGTWAGNPPASVLSFASQALPVTLPNHPTLTITSVGGVSAPATLTGSFATPDFVLPVGTSNPSVGFAASNIPLGTTLTVTVRGRTGGVISTATSSGLAGSLASSTASATVTVPTDQPGVISATSSFTVVADGGGGPLYADGEPVERVLVTSTLGRGSEVTYITVSGREFVVASAR